jgi:hypothetical protein
MKRLYRDLGPLGFFLFLVGIVGICVTPILAQSVTSVTLTWNADPATATTEAAVTYNVYHSTTPTGPFVKVNTTPISVLTFVDTVNKSGFWAVSGVGSDGQEGTKSAGVTFLVNPPAVPTGLKVVVVVVN